MPKLPSRLRRLDDALADLPLDEPMLLTELDGFLTGVRVCPELIMPGEWLPVIWGGEGTPFEDPTDVQIFVDMVMGRYNEIVRDLGRGKLQPIFDVDERNGDVLWEMWVDGFEQAMALRPNAWATVADSEDEVGTAALSEMLMFAEIASGESALMSHEINELSDEGPSRISAAVVAMHASRLRKDGGAAVSSGARGAKVGRNEACPCGSGKKYKRCCGLN